MSGQHSHGTDGRSVTRTVCPAYSNNTLSLVLWWSVDCFINVAIDSIHTAIALLLLILGGSSTHPTNTRIARETLVECSLTIDVRHQTRQTQLTLAGLLLLLLCCVGPPLCISVLLQHVQQYVRLFLRVLECPRQQQAGAVDCNERQTSVEERRRAALVEQSQQRLHTHQAQCSEWNAISVSERDICLSACWLPVGCTSAATSTQSFVGCECD